MKIIKNLNQKKIGMKSKIFSRNNLNFDKKKDFIIIPEIWAHFATDLKFAEKGISYVFLLSFYHMNSTNNFLNLKNLMKVLN